MPSQDDPAAALEYVARAEQLVAVLPDIPAGVRPREIARVAVVGAGVMGAGIAAACLAADLPVTLVDKDRAAVDRAASRIRQIVDRDQEKGRITAEAALKRLGRLTLATEPAAAVDGDLIVEAVFEDLAVKRDVLRILDAAKSPSAILASNTSAMDINRLAEFTGDPTAFIGLHFFSPANIMRLVEVIPGARTNPEVAVTAMAFAKRLKKVGVVSQVCDGFIGNRIFEEYLRQAYFLLEEGALPQDIDGAMERWGMAMGPLAVMDLAGQDIGRDIRRRRAVEQPDRLYSPIPDRIAELGRFGQKTGAGFYLYPDPRTRVVDPDIERLIAGYSEEIGLARRPIGEDEIVERCLLAMINEGAKILDEGVAYRPADIDVVYLNGYGFPAARGGPMFQADLMGLDKVVAAIERRASGRNGWSWAPSPLLTRLAASGATFAGLNAR